MSHQVNRFAMALVLSLTAGLVQAEQGELLYNGIRLPAVWPPRMTRADREVARRPRAVPYLEHPPAVIPIDVGRQLFVDDFLIEKTDLARTFHRPEKYAQNPLLKPETPLEMNRGKQPCATVFQDGLWFDPQDRRFKMWYHAGWFDGTAYAVSRDGLHWERPTLDVVPGTNRILPAQGHGARDGCAVWLDHDTADPRQRFKMFLYERPEQKFGGQVFTSPDGIHWSQPTRTPTVGDNTSILYNPFRKKWVYSVRNGFYGRARAYREHDDLVRGAQWTKDELVQWAWADDLDRPDPQVGDRTQLYNLDAVAYESLMLGVWAIHRGPENNVCEKLKQPKLTDLTLAYSRDGFHWHRPDRQAFLAATRREGDWDRAYLHSVATICAVVGDRLYFYYGAWSGKSPALSGDIYAGGATGVAFLRRDGFASMDAGPRPGTLTTRPITFQGKYPFVNVDAKAGQLRVEILDVQGKPIAPFTLENCVPIQVDRTRQKIQWNGAADLARLSGKPVRFRFQLTGGRLYAFWVSPEPSGASHGYVAAGGPEFHGPVDTGQDTNRGSITIENAAARLVLSSGGGIKSLTLRDWRELLAQADARLMLLRINGKWHPSSSLLAVREGDAHRLLVGFRDTAVTARVVLKPHARYFEVQAVGLEGEGRNAVGQWVFANVPVSVGEHVGGWLNVAWDDSTAVALIGLDEKTNAGGSPTLRATAIQKLGLGACKAALIACPRSAILDVIRQVEKEHGLPCPTLGGQWAKTSPAARKSWIITRLNASDRPAAFQADRVFQTAQSLGVEYVVIALGSWNTSFGSYALNRKNFPEGLVSLKAVADQAHARGLKLGIHVMTRSITKNDALVTPQPDSRLSTEGEVALAAPVSASAKELPTVESPAGFGTASGYWAYGGTDVLVDKEIIRYQGINDHAPFALTACVRGANGTKAADHAAGTKIRHLTERYGWYVASPELAEEIGRKLARLIDDTGLDMVCFDGADVTADPETRCFDAHKVPLGIYRNVQRDVLIVSNGTSHYGWHLMARGGEDDAMARGFQGWVDFHTVHGWGAYHLQNLLPPDFSWVGIFGHTPTMTAARPDDVELVCARSLGYDAAIGWGFAACFGGPSDVAVFEQNGRKEELARVIRTYEKMRLEGCFSPKVRQPLQCQGTAWRLLAGGNDSGRLVPARYVPSGIIRPSASETTSWQVQNDLGSQPLRVRIEALPALAAFGSPDNVVVADVDRLPFRIGGRPAAKLSFEKIAGFHPQAGAVAALRCTGPDPRTSLPAKVAGHSESAWARVTADFPAPLDLRRHRALGLWIKGDAGGEVLNVQLNCTPQSCLHFYQPIDFTGWKYCELGEPEGDRVMEYFACEKFALHNTRLDRFTGVTLMILNPPRGKRVDLCLGRIEALREVGGELVHPEIVLQGQSLRLPVTLLPEQYLETGDPWGCRDPAICRVFDADGHELQRIKLAPPPNLSLGRVALRFAAQATPAARAKVTLFLEGR